MDKQRVIKQYKNQIFVKINNIGRESREQKSNFIMNLEKNNLIYHGKCTPYEDVCDFCNCKRNINIVLLDKTTYKEYFIDSLCFNIVKEIQKLFLEISCIKHNFY